MFSLLSSVKGHGGVALVSTTQLQLSLSDALTGCYIVNEDSTIMLVMLPFPLILLQCIAAFFLLLSPARVFHYLQSSARSSLPLAEIFPQRGPTGFNLPENQGSNWV